MRPGLVVLLGLGVVLLGLGPAVVEGKKRSREKQVQEGAAAPKVVRPGAPVDGSALNREDVASQLEQLILASQLPVADLHGLLDQAWARTHAHEAAAQARPALVALLGQHKPEELDTVDSLLRANKGRETELVAQLTTELAEQAAPPPKVVKAKYIVVGAGPAGLQLGYFMERANRDYLILEKTAAPGSSFKLYPRHRQLISINKRFAGDTSDEFHMRHDWNSLLSDQPGLLFRHFSEEYYPPADALVDYLGEYAAQLGLRVRYNTTITEVKRDSSDSGSGFVLLDIAGTRYECEQVIMATGLKTNEPDTIVGAEHAVTYEKMSLDRAEYQDKKVLILGKGNAAFETAWHLMPAAAEIRMISRNPVRLAPITHYVGDLRVVNDEALGAYQLKSLVSLLETDAQIKNTTIRYTIVKDEPMFKGTKEEGKLAFYYERLGGPPGEEAELYRKRGPVAYDNIILCAGFVLDQSIFTESTQPEMDYREKYPVLTPAYESVNQPGMYFAGTIGHSRDWRKSSGGFIHGFRYTARALHRWLELAHEDGAWPSTLVKTDPMKLSTAVLGRMAETSGLYQMFSELSDVLVITPKGSRHFHEVPHKLIPALLAKIGLPKSVERAQIYTVMLEYGRCYKDESVVLRNRYCGAATCYSQSNLIHPVIRYFDTERDAVDSIDMAKPLREFHLTEDLNTVWQNQERFTVPLATFFARTVGLTTEESLNGDVPLLVAERDTTAPFPNCELEKVGQLLFDKYDKLIDTEPDLANFMLLQAAKFMPKLTTKHWGGQALDTVRELIASADAAQVSACTTPGSSVEQCVAATAPEQVATSHEAAQAWNTSAYELLGTFEDLGEHPQSPRGPFWATPQSLKNWGFGKYEDKHAVIGGAVRSVNSAR